ncbi:xylanase/chitin deacetylase [Paraglaciecola mesophila KMM 241]|uniref:Xylanase/chitin deacetylase n=1 Tax=Paraglaciecola mesophila KMM 241 TaxID=1128912 RepID=K6YH34_9ALTE|nr:XrtA system polysaccharide deacetylase [Paraglaciecola mesophila]GAC23281.1 xylanase/chitin deacetylase [Paraglaciecola mesophila KMM 241]|tara:strand:- start:15119 stop:15964 length:846 start_codon:yes stop_codon:yes gene_type:complete
MPVKGLNAMTVDVEDFFHVSAFESVITPDQWKDYQPRVDKNTRTLLEMFAKHNVKSTFFVLGWVAERYPELIKEIHAQGHEIASHGYAHRRATEQTREQFTADVTRSKNHLEDLLGEALTGYRAPSFSIGYNNEWAFEVLAELGFKYSSSTYPVKHDLYGTPDWPRFAYTRKEGIIEIPIPTHKVMGRQTPIGGGGYFRLYPYTLTKSLITGYLKKEKQPYSFYFHPWEIDADQPRMTNAPLKSRFRHYVNLNKTQGKLERLLNDFSWDTMKSVYDIDKTS